VLFYLCGTPLQFASGAATVSLYFTQQEFNNFNAFPGHGADLPTSPLDTNKRANIRIFQYHGFSATGLPGSYTGTGVEIDSADSNIIHVSSPPVLYCFFRLLALFILFCTNRFVPLY
jgi:hypothetical protein